MIISISHSVIMNGYCYPLSEVTDIMISVLHVHVHVVMSYDCKNCNNYYTMQTILVV